jgi:cobalt-precorrin 5A hydrolase/precorrin-3B C17-methyltransferase
MITGAEIKTWRKRVAIGLGCDRGTPVAELRALLLDCLREAALSLPDIACLATVDVKTEEAGLRALAQELDLPLHFFPASDLEQETPRLANPSEAVFCAIGCHGVAEAAALAALGPASYLLLPKRRSVRATCAMAALPVDEPISVRQDR